MDYDLFKTSWVEAIASMQTGFQRVWRQFCNCNSWLLICWVSFCHLCLNIYRILIIFRLWEAYVSILISILHLTHFAGINKCFPRALLSILFIWLKIVNQYVAVPQYQRIFKNLFLLDTLTDSTIT
jgi:hypothetical protein